MLYSTCGFKLHGCQIWSWVKGAETNPEKRCLDSSMYIVMNISLLKLKFGEKVFNSKFEVNPGISKQNNLKVST